jgi:hypothetical protein
MPWLDRIKGWLRAAWGWLTERVRPRWERAKAILGIGPRPQPAAAPAAAPERSASAAEDRSDETALARMLASEDRDRNAKIVIGWLTVQRMRARGVSMFQMLTAGHGYGPQDRRAQGHGIMYASTAKPATEPDRELARGLLSGQIQASEPIRKMPPGAWVERGQGLSDQEMIRKQEDWKEGIYARVEGTNWFLYSKAAEPIRVMPPYPNAKIRLDSLKDVPATDAQTHQ